MDKFIILHNPDGTVTYVLVVPKGTPTDLMKATADAYSMLTMREQPPRWQFWRTRRRNRVIVLPGGTQVFCNKGNLAVVTD